MKYYALNLVKMIATLSLLFHLTLSHAKGYSFDAFPSIFVELNPSVVSVDTETDSGSGLVVSADGYILTSRFLTENKSGLRVTLYNGEEYSARLITFFTEIPLALIKIKTDNRLTAIEFGDSDQLNVGEPVMSIINIDRHNRPSLGVILTREHNFIQTDTPFPAGFMGGPLVDNNGNIIGVNLYKEKGVNLAVPTSFIKQKIGSTEDIIKSAIEKILLNSDK